MVVIIDEACFLGDGWREAWEAHNANHTRKRSHVMFTVDVSPTITFSWLEPDPDYAKPRDRHDDGAKLEPKARTKWVRTGGKTENETTNEAEVSGTRMITP